MATTTAKNRNLELATQHSPTELFTMYDLKTLKIMFENINESKLTEQYLEKCKQDFKKKVLNEKMSSFWKEFDYDPNKLADQQNNTEMKNISIKVFHKINQLFTKISEWIQCPIFELVFKDDHTGLERFRNLLKVYIRAAFEWEIHRSFHHCLFIAYSYGFKLSMSLKNKLNNSNSKQDHERWCDLCTSSSLENLNIIGNDDSMEIEQRKEQQSFKCSCKKTMEHFIQMNKQLRELNLLKIIANDAILSTVHSHIEKYIKENCESNLEISWLDRLEVWVEEIVIEWLKVIYGDQIPAIANNSKDRLTHFIYETYGQIRIKQMFDIIIEYPDSEAALKDLKYCIEKCTGYREKVIDSLKASFEIRLLHPGVATNDILTAYIQAIRALRILDQSGVILELVCDSVKKYLISRDDTVRCIITALTDENSELIPELTKNTRQPVDEGNQSDDEYICEHWEDWQPDPLDAGKLTNSSRSLRTSDIVSILVNIYESKDLFVQEYQRLLAQKFLSTFECNEENERRYLELLTLRFGESDLDACEVMLKDMNQSKKLDTRINMGEISKHYFNKFPIKCLTVSLEFWPENLSMLSEEEMNKYRHSSDKDDSNKMKLPDIVQQAISSYTKCFETINANRTMYWIYSLGQVELDLEFSEDKKISFTVSPIQASIIWNFQEKSTWSINELSKKLSVPSTTLRRKILFWQNKGILKETKNDVFTLVDDEQSNETSNSSKMDTDLKCNYEDEMLDIDDDDDEASEKRLAQFY